MDQKIILGDIDITNLMRAGGKFQAILQEPKNEIVRDAAIQRFEFTYELTWKTMKRILKAKGIIVNNPRDVFREAAKQDLIKELENWFKYIEYRNLTTHVYNEEIAEELYSKLPTFDLMVQQFISVCLVMEQS